MYIKKRFFVLGLALVVSAVLGPLGYAESVQPGSEQDPLVTRSYVEQRINDALGSAGNTFIPVSAEPGDIILGHEGTEIILRSGQAAAHCPGFNGLVDVSRGGELFHDHEINQNHLMIIPRRDERGVRAVTEAWFMIKGGYDVIK